MDTYTVGAEAEREVLQTLLQTRRKLLGQEELEASLQPGMSFETAEKGAGFRRGKVAQEQALSAATTTSTSASSPVATAPATAADTAADASEGSVAETQGAGNNAEAVPDGGETEAAARKARLAKVCTLPFTHVHTSHRAQGVSACALNGWI